MFERFSSASRRIVVSAEAEARALGHNFIGTEHVTLALAGEAAAGSRAHDLLVGSGIDVDDLRAAVREMIGPGGGRDAPAAPWPAGRARRRRGAGAGAARRHTRGGGGSGGGCRTFGHIRRAELAARGRAR